MAVLFRATRSVLPLVMLAAAAAVPHSTWGAPPARLSRMPSLLALSPAMSLPEASLAIRSLHLVPACSASVAPPSFAAVSSTLTAIAASPASAERTRASAAATLGRLRTAVRALETGGRCHRFFHTPSGEWAVCCELGDGSPALVQGPGGGGADGGGGRVCTTLRGVGIAQPSSRGVAGRDYFNATLGGAPLRCRDRHGDAVYDAADAAVPRGLRHVRRVWGGQWPTSRGGRRHGRPGGHSLGRGSSKRSRSRLPGVVRVPMGAAVGGAASDVVLMRRPQQAPGRDVEPIAKLGGFFEDQYVKAGYGAPAAWARCAAHLDSATLCTFFCCNTRFVGNVLCDSPTCY